jgi:NTP pyrophosphatase (non-canonical NTP hydrolase)
MADKFDYMAQASVTNAGKFFGDTVGFYEFLNAVVRASAAIEELDRIKKALFYGAKPRAAQGEPCTILLDVSPNRADTIDFIHGVLGVVTEGGELLELLQKHLFLGMELDKVNLSEEIGDAFWYQHLLATVAGMSFDHIQRQNIAKLRKRYQMKFTEHEAKQRDLKAERATLEDFEACDPRTEENNFEKRIKIPLTNSEA